MTSSSEPVSGNRNGLEDKAHVTLEMRPERRLIGAGSHRHVDFLVRVGGIPGGAKSKRSPVAISLVLDRSGSMHGEKMETARRAALAVLDKLEDSDRIAAVIFDDRIDVLQAGAPATREVKARLRAELGAVQARANTALHEGWLTGCRAIAPDRIGATVARCFLLTDGLANVGLTNAEQIASETAGVREHAGVGTSTFGIGEDYDESLLGPMAVAGGGQFHRLRSPAEIAHTFLGELGELLTVAASNVRLEVEASGGTDAEFVSPYWARQLSPTQWSVELGDLLAGEDRHVIVRFAFTSQLVDTPHVVRARLVWVGVDGEADCGRWHEIGFEHADSATRAAEPPDRTVLRIVGQHHADRARQNAIRLSRQGDVHGARKLLRRVAQRIVEYAGTDTSLQQTLADLRAAERELEQHGYQSAQAKEAYFLTQTRARGQRDLRQS